MSRFLLSLPVILAMATVSRGQGIIAPTAGPINSSMAGASVAAPVDFGASYWNPAILAPCPATSSCSAPSSSSRAST